MAGEASKGAGAGAHATGAHGTGRSRQASQQLCSALSAAAAARRPQTVSNARESESRIRGAQNSWIDAPAAANGCESERSCSPAPWAASSCGRPRGTDRNVLLPATRHRNPGAPLRCVSSTAAKMTRALAPFPVGGGELGADPFGLSPCVRDCRIFRYLFTHPCQQSLTTRKIYGHIRFLLRLGLPDFF